MTQSILPALAAARRLQLRTCMFRNQRCMICSWLPCAHFSVTSYSSSSFLVQRRAGEGAASASSLLRPPACSLARAASSDVDGALLTPAAAPVPTGAVAALERWRRRLPLITGRTFSTTWMTPRRYRRRRTRPVLPTPYVDSTALLQSTPEQQAAWDAAGSEASSERRQLRLVARRSALPGGGTASGGAAGSFLRRGRRRAGNDEEMQSLWQPA